MRSPEQERDRRHRKEAAKRDRDLGLRGCVSRGRLLEAHVAVGQLPVRESLQLRILEAGNGAGAEDVNGFWFTIGYSIAGGPDIVRLI